MRSERLYRALLHLYPASFRAEYAPEMEAIFQRRRQDARGPLAVVALLLGAVAEVALNAAAVHGDFLRQDVRYAARTLRRSVGFTLSAMLLLALGVGANTAAFSVTDFVLLRPLPFPDAGRLVRLWQNPPGYRNPVSPANFRDWKRMATAFESLGALHPAAVNLVGQGDPQRVEASAVTADLLPTLGVEPLFGRLFSADDDREGAPGTVLLSHRLWQSSFGGDAGVLGRKVRLDDRPYTVIGVMPREFQFPHRDVELWLPTQFGEANFEDRTDSWLEVVGRLKPGVPLEQARAEMNVVAARLQMQYPKENEEAGSVLVNRLRDELSRQSRLLLTVLCAAAFCVLLIACANLAHLLLARGLARRQELAVRAAMGAGRERLVRQLATEGLVLATFGGLLGVGVAVAAVPLLTRLVPAALPVVDTPSVDTRVLLFAMLLTGLTGLGFGLAPALRASGQADLRDLREGGRSGGGRKEHLRSALVVAEIVASVVLLVSAGLLMRALWTLRAADPGFRPEGVLTLRTSLALPKYGPVAARDAFYTRVLAEVRSLPGVTHAAYITGVPMTMWGGLWGVTVKDRPQGEHTNASLRYLTPGYFSAMGIPLLRGRDVGEADSRERPFVAVVSDSFARRYWPGQEALGRRFTFALAEREIVGVVGDVRVRGLEQTSEPQVYLPRGQVEDGSIVGYIPKDLVVRSSLAPASLVPAIRRIVRAVDPEQPLSNVRSMTDVVDATTASRGVQLRVIGAFALVAAVLAAVGIHGLLSFAVAQRSREIGVRIALGAEPRDILKMVLRQALRLAAAGVLPGIALAYVAGRALEALLAGVRPGDPATYLAVVLLCVVMTVAGSLQPTLRAVRLDPVGAIRNE